MKKTLLVSAALGALALLGIRGLERAVDRPVHEKKPPTLPLQELGTATPSPDSKSPSEGSGSAVRVEAAPKISSEPDPDAVVVHRLEPTDRHRDLPEGMLEKRGDALVFREKPYLAMFRRGAFEMKGPGGRGAMLYALEEIRLGDRVLVDARQPSLPERGRDGREVVFAHGSVREEYVLGASGVEQSFRITELPSREADLVVRGVFRSGLRAKAATGRSLTLGAASQGATLTISKAVALDAGGRKLDLDLALADGRLEMTVPRGWLAEAALPILVDPTFELIETAAPALSAREAVVEARGDLLREKSGTFGYNSGRYGVGLRPGAMEVVINTELEDKTLPRFQFTLEEVSVGGKALRMQAATSQVRAASRSLSFDHGTFVEEYLLHEDLLKQQFVFAQLPEGRGEIRVTGAVGSNLSFGAEEQKGDRLALKAGDLELIVIDDAVAVDGAGRSVPVVIEFAKGRLSMSIPADWVAAATLPITLDPLIGAPVTVDATVSSSIATVNSRNVRSVDVAYSATNNEYLVVWNERFSGGSYDYDVYAQRVSATGTLVGSQIAVATGTLGDYEASVSWASASNRYLIAWRHDPVDNGSTVTDQMIRGRIVNADGTFFTAGFALDDRTGQDFMPSIATDGTSWFVPYVNVVSTSNYNICGRFVSSAGTPGTTADADTATDYAASPRIAYLSSNYYLVWSNGPNSTTLSIAGRRMNTSGTFSGVAVALDATTERCTDPGISAAGDRLLAVWTKNPEFVEGRDVDLAFGSIAGPFSFPSVSHPHRQNVRALWSSVSQEWYAGFQSDSSQPDLYGLRISATGSIGTEELIQDTSGQRNPFEFALNSATNEALFAYLHRPSLNWEVRIQRFSLDNVAPGAPGQPAGSPNPNATGTFTVSWTASTDTGGSGIQNYDVERSSNGGSNWTAAGTTASLSLPQSGLAQGSYVYRVKARDNVGNLGAWSAVSSAVLVDNSVPGAVGGLSQFKLDGTTSITVGGVSNEDRVILKSVVHDDNLFDDFEDGNWTVNPTWLFGSGNWTVGTSAPLSGQCLKSTTVGSFGQSLSTSAIGVQAYGSWEMEGVLHSPSGSNLALWLFSTTTSMQDGYYMKLEGGGGGVPPKVSLMKRTFSPPDQVFLTVLIGTDNNWVPDANPHVIRVTRQTNGTFELFLDGVSKGTAVDTTYTTASTMWVFHGSDVSETAAISYIRTSSSGVSTSLKLQAEIKPVGTAFDGLGLLESGYVSPGQAASVTSGVLTLGSYRWRARQVDQAGNIGAFSSFGGNLETLPDFILDLPAPANFRGTAQSTTSILWEWDNITGETGFVVHDPAHVQKGSVGANVLLFTESAGFTENSAQTRHVHGVNGGTPGGESNSVAKYTLVHAPLAADFSAAPLSAYEVLVTVTAPPNSGSGSTACEVSRSVQGAGSWQIVKDFVEPGYSVTDFGLLPATAYDYRFRFRNGDAVVTAYSPLKSATTLPPPGPATFGGVAQSTTSILWTWTDVLAETGYVLHDGAHVQKGTTGADVLQLLESSGLTENLACIRHVHATRNGQSGTASGEATIYTKVHDPLVGDLTLTAPSHSQVTGTVVSPPNGGSGLTACQVERSPNGTSSWSIVKDYLTSGYGFSDSGLTSATTYYYRLRYRNGNGIETAMLTKSIKTPPEAPGNVWCTSYSAAIDVEWTASPSGPVNVAGYNVYRKLAADPPAGPWTLLNQANGVVLGTKYRDSTAAAATNYTYRVTAVGN